MPEVRGGDGLASLGQSGLVYLGYMHGWISVGWDKCIQDKDSSEGNNEPCLSVGRATLRTVSSTLWLCIATCNC